MENLPAQPVQQEMEFSDYTIALFYVQHKAYFIPRHACERIGLSWSSQAKKLRDNPQEFECITIETLGDDGRPRPTLGMPARNFNKWIMGVNAVNVRGEGAERKRAILKVYQEQLTDWLHARDFLDREEIAAVEQVAADRGACLVALDQPTMTISDLLALPSSPQLEAWRTNRVMQLTDQQLGFCTAAQIGRREPLTLNAFYHRWVVEDSCDDRMVLLFDELDVPAAVQDYADQHGLCRPDIPQLELGFVQKARLLKGHIWFGQSIGDLVVRYNLPAGLIHQCMWELHCWLLGIFHENQVDLGPDPIDTIARKALLNRYYGMPEWIRKRDATFAVYNGCPDCGAWEIVSKNFQLHHPHYQTIGREHPYDLVPLCGPCHAKREQKRREESIVSA
jgi:hypothetical protein